MSICQCAHHVNRSALRVKKHPCLLVSFFSALFQSRRKCRERAATSQMCDQKERVCYSVRYVFQCDRVDAFSVRYVFSLCQILFGLIIAVSPPLVGAALMSCPRVRQSHKIEWTEVSWIAGTAEVSEGDDLSIISMSVLVATHYYRSTVRFLLYRSSCIAGPAAFGFEWRISSLLLCGFEWIDGLDNKRGASWWANYVARKRK